MKTKNSSRITVLLLMTLLGGCDRPEVSVRDQCLR